ncbi:MAG: TrkH family potassium uptake protein, partial [Eubacteriales bacterium]|nr:TrkH family potassium uptake protein [Eubacteriales bacterium]
MNCAIVRFVIGRILFITGLLMLPSVAVALYYREGWAGVWPFLIPIAIALLLGTVLSFRRPKNPDFFMRE